MVFFWLCFEPQTRLYIALSYLSNQGPSNNDLIPCDYIFEGIFFVTVIETESPLIVNSTPLMLNDLS